MEELRIREGELINIVKAIDGVLRSEDWKVLEEGLWSRRVETIERLILSAAKDGEINLPAIYKLQGRRDEAKRYLNLKEYGESLVKELEAVKLKLK